MRGYLAFTKKEFLESTRSFKLYIMLAVYLLFGVISPLFAKIMPDLFANMNMDGIIVQMKPPAAIDSYTQFFKNVSQMGMLVLILVFCGMLSSEIAKGTLIGLVSKGLSRTAIIFSKFTVSILIWTASLGLSAFTTYFYTLYYWSDKSVKNLFFSMLCIWLFGVLFLCSILLSGAIFKGYLGGLIMPVVVLCVLLFSNIIPSFQKYNPLYIASVNVDLIDVTKNIAVADVLPSFFITVGLCVIFLALTVSLFRKKLL